MTGAASGIGRAGAMAFAHLGADVMVADIDVAGAEETVALLEAEGVRAAALECDVTVEADVERLVAMTVETFGRLDAAFNNAGRAMAQYPIHETPLEHWNASMAVNLTGTFLCLKHEVRHMMEHGGGCIVNTASGAARVPAPGRAPYSAAKRGVVALTAHVAQDYGRHGIRVNAVLPGLIDTPGVRGQSDAEKLERMAAFLPGGRLGEPAHVGDVAAWLCTDATRYINGQAIVVDGGSILA